MSEHHQHITVIQQGLDLEAVVKLLVQRLRRSSWALTLATNLNGGPTMEARFNGIIDGNEDIINTLINQNAFDLGKFEEDFQS